MARRSRAPAPPDDDARAVGAVVDAVRAAIGALRVAGLGSGQQVLVGVSGGQDSLTLLHALWRLRDEHGWALRVVHVDHRIRSAGAAERARVAALAAAWGLPAEVVRVDVPAYRRRERLNLQQAARYARYQAFARCAAEHAAAAVAVGHTADDVAETLLLHLIRGAGLDGLAAPPLLQDLPRPALGPPTDGPPLPEGVLVARLLLAVARAETTAYCRAHGLVPVAEAHSPYRRDRVRAELLPALERYNPAARRAVARAAVALAEERAALERGLDRLWPDLVVPRDGAIDIPLAAWTALPLALRKRALRRAVANLAGTDDGLGERSLAAALRLADKQSGRGVDLPRGLRLERVPSALRLAPRADVARPPAGESPLAIPGQATLPGIGTVRAAREPAATTTFPPAGALECWVDAAALEEPLAVRLRRPGDRFQPLGMATSMRLQDFLVNARVPRAARDRLPLVVRGNEVVWVVGRRIADWARVRADSGDIVRLSFEPAAGDD